MDIRTLSQRTGIGTRQLRYVLDHELVPERTWFLDEHAVGRARTFDEITAVLIASAAFLLEAGYKRDSVRVFLESISRIKPKGRNPLNVPVIADVITGKSAARVQFGDGQYVRWITSRADGKWVDPTAPTRAISDLQPKVVIELNLGEIRDVVRNS